MICRVVPAVLLSLSLSLSGCAVYDLDSPRYSASRYSGYGYQQPDYSVVRSGYGYQQPRYPVVRYREYPAPVYRYPQRQPVYIYQQAPSRYRAAPGWQGYRDEDRHYRHHERRSYYQERQEQQGRQEWQERHERDGDQRRGRDEHRGWELRLN